MGMKDTIAVINQMERDGIIARYAIAGAVAAYNYVEPALTEDLDLLVAFAPNMDQTSSGLITLSPILSYLKFKGFTEYRNEGVVIAGWPVQFLPVANDLDAEALANAQEVEIQISDKDGAIDTRVLGPEYLMAIALRVGRPKDLIRIAQFIEEDAFDPVRLRNILDRHQLKDSWRTVCQRTGINDPLEPG